MGQARLPVRKIREVLRLKAEGYSDRQIAQSIGSSRSTVQECLRRAREADLSWPVPTELDESALQARLYRRAVPLSRTPQPDFAQLHRELQRRGVTRLLLWKSARQRTLTAGSTACSAISTGAGWRARSWCRGKSMPPGTSCSSITPGRPCRSLIGTRASRARHRSLSRCSAAPT